MRAAAIILVHCAAFIAYMIPTICKEYCPCDSVCPLRIISSICRPKGRDISDGADHHTSMMVMHTAHVPNNPLDQRRSLRLSYNSIWTHSRELSFPCPSEVHRHPRFLEQGRSMAFHWCDLCRQRMKGTDDGEVYRCSLCDFDACIPCSRGTMLNRR